MEYHRVRTQDPAVGQDAPPTPPDDPDAPQDSPDAATQDPAATTARPDGSGSGAHTAATAHAEALALLEHQILAQVIQIVSGPAGVASFLRRNLLDKPLGGPSLPLDVGQTEEMPVHLRRLVALRDQRCRFPGGCDQPASACEPHHVVHRADGGPTSLANLQDWCWWHHHVVLHQMGWKLDVHPDGTSQVTSPTGSTIHSHKPNRPHPAPASQATSRGPGHLRLRRR